jgi:hypothetical protein
VDSGEACEYACGGIATRRSGALVIVHATLEQLGAVTRDDDLHQQMH